ncbi:TRAP transporter permease [Spiractinospora alimapuensis]|uniref:TRAP transporter permease n=1 Tax=Spiractinospora alimapuensis TaxID=2820884 RepID=UPI001F327975|nr:TRAP transporter permease [Spiractinospora alimapuensis]QVQ51007.1 TRAP transporter permease [Spiractinospora alimapuensis]
MAEDVAKPASGEAQAVDDKTLEETLRKYDQESTFRTQLGMWKWVVLAIGTALTAFQLYTALFGNYVSLIQGAIHVAGAMSLVYLLYPAKKAWATRPGVPWYDVVLCGLALWTNFHIVSNYERLTTETVIFGFTDYDFGIAVAGILLILEATRRCVGVPIVVIAGAALAYGYFGSYIPVFGHAGLDLRQLATESYYTSRSIFGTPIQVSSTFIFLFLFFGVILVKTNIGQFFNDLAFAATGRFTGGTAKAAVVASGLQGMVSGSSVANTVASGSFTIPMMKRAGFRPQFAGAVEATASTGGQLVPPVMGAAAFIMAEYTSVPYSDIILIAVIPVALYYLGLFFSVHFEARRTGVHGSPKDMLPRFAALLPRFYLVAPLVVILGLLLAGRSPANAALFGILTALVVSLFRRDTRMSLPELGRLMENGARAALPVISACATAGIIAGTVTTTGLGGKLAGGILDLAQGQFFLILLLTALACLVLGMGLPTTANYVVTATVAAPILVEFGVPLIAAHMFVFYFGIVADITPPVCLAAYAASGLARSNPMKTGVTAFKLAIAAFIVPFMFVIEPELLLIDVTLAGFVPALATAVIGIGAIAAGLIGFRKDGDSLLQRLLLVGGGLLLVYPSWVSLIGVAIVVAAIIFGQVQARMRDTKVTTDV